MNHDLMGLFSQRTTEGLKQHSVFRLTLPAFQSFLELNVNKETKKDRRVIQHAASLLRDGNLPGDKDIQFLLDKARETDQAFLRQINPLPIRINIQYHAIETIRQQRINQLLDLCYNLLRQWQKSVRFRAAIQALYDGREFQETIYGILHLYSLESRQLSNSVHIPVIPALAWDSLSRTIYDVMDSAAKELATEARNRFYS